MSIKSHEDFLYILSIFYMKTKMSIKSHKDFRTFLAG